MTSLNERLEGKVTGQAMEYKESVHNAQGIAQNAIVSVAKKVEDNTLCMMTALVIVPQKAVQQHPVANPL